MTGSIVRWEDPPPHGNKARPKPLKYQAAADALRQRLGAWALVVDGIPITSAGTLAHHIRTGQGPWAPGSTFEAKSAGSGDGTGKVYARYVGGDER